MDFLFAYSLFALACADIPEVCFPSIVRHRIDSILPSSRLFCVSKQNDELDYGSLEIVNDDEQWFKFSKSRFNSDSIEDTQDTGVLYFSNTSAFRVFKLPATISESDFCTGSQSVELKRNFTVKCKPLATADMKSQCTENYLLNSLALFGNGEFMERTGNKSVIIPKIHSGQLGAPIWNGSMCIGVVQSSNLVYHTNESHITAVEVNVDYSNLPGNVDNNWFEQTFTVQWISEKKVIDNEPESNKTKPRTGYKPGDRVYRVQNSVPVPYAVPTLGNCYSEYVVPSPVLFLRPMLSVCTVDTTNCEDARAKAKVFYDRVYPSELVSSLSEDAPSVVVGRINVTWEELSPSTTSCRLPVASLFQIYYAKQGSTKNFYEVIVSGSIQLLLDDVSYTPGQLIRLPISVSFTDVSQSPKHIFAALPYIDIRLPHDFFYPFIRSLAPTSLCYTIIVYIVLYVHLL